MLLVLTPATVRRPQALRLRAVPAPLLRHWLAVAPPGALPGRAFWRLFFEHSLPRYVTALLPFPVAMLIWPELALPISQAPLLMIGLVLFIESSVLSVASPERRRRLVDRAEAARGLDLLRVHATDVLTRIAARRGLATGELHLVVEQSAMARVEPLTLLSIQAAGDPPAVLDLDGPEQDMLRHDVFDAELTEARLHRINLAENTFLRSTALDARSVSAHARLAALARA